MDIKYDIFDAIFLDDGNEVLSKIARDTICVNLLHEALCIAVDDNSLSAVKILLDADALVYSPGDGVYVEKTLRGQKYGALVSYENSFAFRLACEVGNEDMVTLFLQDTACDPSYDNYEGLRLAVSKNHLAVVEKLLISGSDANASNGYSIIYAASTGNADMVELLISHGADIHIFDDHPLRKAAKKGHSGVVSVLIAAGAKVDALDNYAIYWATKNGHKETLALLESAYLGTKVTIN